MTPELRNRLAQEIVAKFRGNFSGQNHDLLTFAEVQGRLKSYAVDLELKWRTSRRNEPRGYEDAEVLRFASELISQEQTLRVKERRGDYVAEAPIVSVSQGSKNWLAGERKWPEQGYWLRYHRWLLGRRPADVIEALDRDTNVILGRMGNPNDAHRDVWDVRGLVVGQVQSGKTQNFVGLLAKAIDMGYRQVIVLSGVHEDLRAQTQYRVDEGLTGQTFFDAEDGGQEYQQRYVGVREEDPSNIAMPDYVAWTSGSKKDGDISSVMATRATSISDFVYISVVKKSTARLKRLNSMYASLPHLRAQPLVVIDDEADQASINNQVKDNPTEINKQIRKLLLQFPRSSYVGYTATPFANIFGDPDHETINEGEDLFPRDFIVRLGQGPGYFGPAELFGRKPTVLAEELGRIPADTMVQIADDVQSWVPPSSGDWPNVNPLPESLLMSIADFLVGAAVKAWRRDLMHQITPHTTMLVNVPRVQEQQNKLVAAIEEVCEAIKRDVSGDNDAADSWIARLRQSFSERILPYLTPGFDDVPPSWPEIISRIGELIEHKLVVALVNGTVKDMLDYDKHKVEGRLVIAVGGDKLSRGMTLEGLTVAYFLRRSNAWDTLLQMGRWFGYRPGYLDLCRLATTELLFSRFKEVSQRVEELDLDLEEKFSQGEEPKKIGMYVSKSELSLLPTRRSALRGAKEIAILDRHSARTVQRGRLALTEVDMLETLQAARWLFERARSQNVRPQADGLFMNGRHLHTFSAVPCVTVAEYVRRSVLPPGARGQSNELLAQNLLKLAKEGMVTEWTVCFPTNSGGRVPSVTLAEGVSIVPSERKSLKAINGYFEVSGDISDARDIWADFTVNELAKLGVTIQSDWVKIRRKAALNRPERRGLLVCYVVESNNGPSATWHMSFPEMPREEPYQVWANPVALRSIYGTEENE